MCKIKACAAISHRGLSMVLQRYQDFHLGEAGGQEADLPTLYRLLECSRNTATPHSPMRWCGCLAADLRCCEPWQTRSSPVTAKQTSTWGLEIICGSLISVQTAACPSSSPTAHTTRSARLKPPVTSWSCYLQTSMPNGYPL